MTPNLMKHLTPHAKTGGLLLLALSLSACQTFDKKTACAPLPASSKPPVVMQTPVATPNEAAPISSKPTKPIKTIKRHTINDMKGVYAAILPCADCLGIETLLTLNGDGQYILHETYENLEKSAFDSYGRWVIAGGQIIVLIPAEVGQTAYQFAIDSPHHLSMLGMGGEHRNDERYVLKRR